MTEKIKCGEGFIILGEPCPPIPSVIFFDMKKSTVKDFNEKNKDLEKGNDDQTSQSS